MAEDILKQPTHEEITAQVVAETAKATAKAVLEAATAAAQLIAKDASTANQDIAVLKNEVASLSKRMDGFDINFEKIFSKLDVINLGRPTWMTSNVITLLVGLCSALIMYIVTHL